MRRISAAVVFVFLVSGFGFAQVQRGNASYNPLKPGFTISHSSLSFNTHVRITNLKNKLSVEASVNGRIPINAELIAEISREAGDALQMDKTGMTLVEIAILPARPAPAPITAADPPVRDAAPPPRPPQPAPPAPQDQPAALPPPPPPVQTLTDVRYVPVPVAAQSCCPWPFVLAALIPLILALIILIIMLALFLRRLSRWPRYYPLWLRRGYWSGKRKRRGMGKHRKKR
jgi:hypothetical protein